jgi:hypothetical protein
MMMSDAERITALEAEVRALQSVARRFLRDENGNAIDCDGLNVYVTADHTHEAEAARRALRGERP